MTSHKPTHVVSNDVPWEDLGQGLRRKILGHDENLMMVQVEFQKGSIGTVHSHPHTQVTYIVSGSFEVQIGDKKKVLRAGDSFFVIPNLQHGVVALEISLLVDIFTPRREDFLKAGG